MYRTAPEHGDAHFGALLRIVSDFSDERAGVLRCATMQLRRYRFR